MLTAELTHDSPAPSQSLLAAVDVQLFQLTFRKAYATRLQGAMGNFLIKLPNLGYGSPLQKMNHIGKCLWYFHPSCGNDSREITAESQKVYSYPY